MEHSQPVWQLPVLDRYGFIRTTMKCHCFVNGHSLCGQYCQHSDFYETDVDGGAVLENPSTACKTCYNVWLKKYGKNE